HVIAAFRRQSLASWTEPSQPIVVPGARSPKITAAHAIFRDSDERGFCAGPAQGRTHEFESHQMTVTQPSNGRIATLPTPVRDSSRCWPMVRRPDPLAV